MADKRLDRDSWSRLLRTVRSVTRADDSEDLLHAAFIRLEEYRQRIPVDNPEGFMVRVAANLARDELRRCRSRNHIDITDDEGATVEDGQPLQDEVFATRVRLSRVHSALDTLPRRTRDAFLMHRVEGLKYREIALQMGVTVSAVEKHIARAILCLAERMKDDW